MMFFSRVRISNEALASKQLLKIFHGDIYATHQLIWRLFKEPPGSKRCFLFRQEIEKEQIFTDKKRRGMPIFYVLSTKEPVNFEGLLTVETKRFSPQIEAGMRFGFDIRVNPIISKKIEGKKNSSKHDILMDTKRKAIAEGFNLNNPQDRLEIEKKINLSVLNWFEKKAEQSGFSINPTSKSFPLEISSYRQNKISKKSNHNICFSSVDISGQLSITEPSLFIKTLQTGIGHSRSFGCGLILLRRI